MQLFWVFFALTTAPLVINYQNNDDLTQSCIQVQIQVNLLSFGVTLCHEIAIKTAFLRVIWVLLSQIAQH